MNQQRQMADKMRAAQDQSHAVEVDGHLYVYKKLKRRRCHQVMHSLVAPFIQIVSTFMTQIMVPVGEIATGKFDPSKLAQGMTKDLTLNTDALLDLVKALPFEDYWALAQNILDDVEVDGVQLGKLDQHEYYDDKHLEMVKAILHGVGVNYPFLKDLIKKKDAGSADLSPESPVPTKESSP
jgi:hypothetical protein